MKLVIRNTSRDKMTAAKRKARPGDVQLHPTIQKVRLPPGGSLTADSSKLSNSEVLLLAKLSGCGCLRVFSRPSYGPMREMDPEEILTLQTFDPTPAPIPEPAVEIEAPVAAVEPEVVNEPEPEPEPEPAPEPEETPAEEPVQEEPAYLEDELKAMKNAELRDILLDMGCDRTTGMNKSALVAKILEMQEA